ncbi:MAG: HAMP domain-containing histidine kinase [Gemmatimonadaceae bacterium]|nr:HAMP domain-containing histidine kinase [Gemmatimonadaceae bacterium]
MAIDHVDRVDLSGDEEQYHLQRLQQMAMLGTLAAGLGHDLRNLVMPVLLRLDVLAASPDLSEQARADLAGIRVSIAHLQRLANGLRLLAADSTPGRNEARTTRLADWWGDVRPLIADALTTETRLVVDVPSNLPAVAIPPGTLAQVMINLVLNARRATEATSSPVFSIAAKASQGVVCVEVRDNGRGMDAETRRRCFEPFFTTRPREFATGLGLSTSRALLQRFGGDLTVASSDESGTAFVLKLPVQSSNEGDADGARSPLTVHLMLRDPRQRTLVRRILGQRGMLPWTPDSGRAPVVVVCDGDALPSVLEAHRAEPGVRIIAIGQAPDQPVHGVVTWIQPSSISRLGDALP